MHTYIYIGIYIRSLNVIYVQHVTHVVPCPARLDLRLPGSWGYGSDNSINHHCITINREC